MALRQRVSSAWDEMHVLLPLGAPLGAAAAAPAGGVPLAEGRRVKGMAWLGPGRLLLVTARHPEPELEDGAGDVMVEVAVDLPEPLMSSPEGEGAGGDLGSSPAAPAVAEAGACYAGGRVAGAAPLPAYGPCTGAGGAGGGDVEIGHSGAALLLLESGALLRYASGATAPAPLGAAAGFPSPVAAFLPVPGPGGAASAVGLTPGGALYCGPRLVAGGVVSFAVRWGGAGGPALLYTTRQNLLYTVMLGRLGAYVHTEVGEGARARLDFAGCGRAGPAVLYTTLQTLL